MSTTSRIEALQRERDSFVSHEQRIIRGTKKIIPILFLLVAMTGFSNQLSIYSLTERDEILANIRNRISAIDNEIVSLGGVLPAVQNEINASENAIVPSEAAFPTTAKKPRGRPRKSDSSDSSKTTSTEKKKRGRPKKQAEEIREDAMSPLTYIANSLISLRNGGSDPKVVIAAATSDESDSQDWECGFCGKMVAESKVRLRIVSDPSGSNICFWNCM
jgi:hypothetical protein